MKKGWFGPHPTKNFFFLPKSREGWIVSLIFFAALIAAGRLGFFDSEEEGGLVLFGILGVYLAVVYLTYDRYS
jgi:hypothetical protein